MKNIEDNMKAHGRFGKGKRETERERQRERQRRIEKTERDRERQRQIREAMEKQREMAPLSSHPPLTLFSPPFHNPLTLV